MHGMIKRSTQDEETQTDADPDGNGATDPGFKPPSNIDKTAAVAPTSSDYLNTPEETARRSTQDEGTQTDADPGCASTDPGAKPPSNFDKKADEAPKKGDKTNQIASQAPHEETARRSTQDEETQTDAYPDGNGSTDPGFKPPSNIDKTADEAPKKSDKPNQIASQAPHEETERRSTQDEETQTDSDPDGTGSTDPGVKPPANIAKTATDQLKTQTSGPYYSEEIYNRIQTKSNKFYPAQTQKQDQLARQKEASKELLYRVYENVIGTLEEFERRCNKRHTKQMLVVSEIDFPDQSDKSDRDVKANMDVQLLLFEEHRKSCPPEFTKKVNGELRMKTIYWAAARGEMGLDETDKYTTNLYEILVKDKTYHAVLDQPRKPVEHKTMRETLQFIMKGNAKAMEIECEYQTDPDKMAKDPKTRKTEIRPYVGAKRIYMCNTDLQPYLDQDVPGFLESDIK